MKNTKLNFSSRRAGAYALLFSSLALSAIPLNSAAFTLANTDNSMLQVVSVLAARKINPTTIEVTLSNKQTILLDFYGNNIFRMFSDPNGGMPRNPQAEPEAFILVDNPRKTVSSLELTDGNGDVVVRTSDIEVRLNKTNATLKITDLKRNKVVVEEASPMVIDSKHVELSLKEMPGEYFYGGGMQNGRFSHKGKVISIENENSWTDGGVASPTPFYWSTCGYGVMFHTFKKGSYDFGATQKDIVSLSHKTDYLDVFYMVNDTPVGLLNDFYQLTGNPVLLPKFAFYQGHLNAYNRDYWKEDSKGILFEDGKRYVESQKDNGGIKESLNGEKNNYQFSARAVIDRYSNHDMPLGWLLPNDGYGAGYGQTSTLDGNIDNLKSLTEYAHKNGVEVGLWTQSDLHPKPEVEALLQRDIVKEVCDAGVRVLKTDVAWVGDGYSFGLNGIADVAQIMPYYGNNARPFIISLDGWAGTQRYAGIWSGDQTGGLWEYIRFHIPTYIGSGLSGQPNVGSDMDGIFGGKNIAVNTRDFQWKTFTPMELNMDGWGANEKYPHALGEPAASINRWYLKMKSELIPYTYSIAKEAVDGKPIIRAMMLDYPNDYTLGKSTQYQFLYGPNFLVAPIYQATKADTLGNDIRNGIYLPEGIWIDYFTGEKYDGGRILNNFESPLWKLPVFVKAGAIIPMAKANNNLAQVDKGLRIYQIYPYGESSFTEYDDDGVTKQYLNGAYATTLLQSSLSDKGLFRFVINPTEGSFDGFVPNKSTEIRINVTEEPKKLSAIIGGKKVKLSKAVSINDFEKGENVYFYDATPNINKYATKGSDFEKLAIIGNPKLLVKLASVDTRNDKVELIAEGVVFNPANTHLKSTGTLQAPNASVTEDNREAYTLKPTWGKVANADYYEITLNNMLYSTIKDTELLFEDLKAETTYNFKIRSVNKDGVSDWASFEATTKSNPLEFALVGVKGETTAPNQEGQEIDRLFNYDEGDTWHTEWGSVAVPFDMLIDLGSINKLDKFEYLPRTDGGNGTLLKGKVYYSNDKSNWTEVGDFDWKSDGESKVFEFVDKPTAGFIKLSVTEAVGKYGSGRELYVFKVPGTESVIPGDINHDRLVDRNDLTSYMNYTGLRLGDSDFEGYVSNGDVNKNNLIDAYDISTVATRIDGGVNIEKPDTVCGSLNITVPKRSFAEGELISVTVSGTSLSDVNAFSFALPYDAQKYEYQGIETIAVGEMENLTNDRLHTNGVKSLYPTFVNMGDKPTLGGSKQLFVIKFKAKKNLTFDLTPQDGLLVGKTKQSKSF